MKRQIHFRILIGISIFIILASLPLFTIGQVKTYEPLVVENAHWKIGWYHHENPPWAPYNMFQYHILGDTLINSIEYKKLWYRDLDDENPEIMLSEVLFGVIREDTASRKIFVITYFAVYIGECPVNEEYLLYDFDLEEGDATEVCLIWIGNPFMINQIVYDEFLGQVRKQFHSLSYLNNFLVEGVGSNAGLLEWGAVVKNKNTNDRGGYYELFDHCIGTDEDCGYIWVGLNEEEDNNLFSIYPNPIIGNCLYIQSDELLNSNAEIAIYDFQGTKIHETKSNGNSNEIVLTIPEFIRCTKSSFLLTIRLNDQPVFKQVIINTTDY